MRSPKELKNLNLDNSIELIFIFLIALIMSDIQHLYTLSHHKELFRKARQVVYFERLSNSLGFMRKASQMPEVASICLHDFCHCKGIKLGAELKQRIASLAYKKRPEKFESRPKTAAAMSCVIDALV